jgi:hypothetical protein
MRKSILTTLIFTLCVITISAQPAEKKQELLQFNKTNYIGWQKIDVDAFSFYLPKEFKGGKRKAIDTTTWKFDNENAELAVFIGAFAPRPDNETNLASFRSDLLIIDSFSAWSFSYEDKNDFKYVNGIGFWSNRIKGFVITIYLSSKDEKAKDLAEKIFTSIKFNSNQIKELNLRKN